MYVSEDGGITWNPVELAVPNTEEFSYINGLSLVKEENSDKQATLILERVGVTENVYFEFVTKDVGKTWELSES